MRLRPPCCLGPVTVGRLRDDQLPDLQASCETPIATAGRLDRRAFASNLRGPMARRSLRPQLNQIRTWVRQGRTDAWIAHQLEVTVQQIDAFKRENDLVARGGGRNGTPGADFDDEIDLRAEDDALIAAELEAEAEAAAAEAEADDAADDGERRRRRRRGRRRRRRARPPPARPPRRPRTARRARPRPARSRARSTTARRATACGSTPPSPTTRSTPSTGPATGPSRSRRGGPDRDPPRGGDEGEDDGEDDGGAPEDDE